ncbi:MAG TPA: hypothetical protein VHA12_02390 [Candidatus Nanoarchaeia archaeon]|nr:hypothetical protein [Candidatus Nanoarchaeia archaeon]
MLHETICYEFQALGSLYRELAIKASEVKLDKTLQRSIDYFHDDLLEGLDNSLIWREDSKLELDRLISKLAELERKVNARI